MDIIALQTMYLLNRLDIPITIGFISTFEIYIGIHTDLLDVHLVRKIRMDQSIYSGIYAKPHAAKSMGFGALFVFIV